MDELCYNTIERSDIMVYSILLVLVVSTISFLLFYKKDYSIKHKLLIAVITSAINIMILVFPLFVTDQFFVRLLNSIYFSIKSIGLGQEMEIVNQIELNNTFSIFYYFLMNFLFLLMPILTTGTIFAFISEAFSKIRLSRLKHHELHIFSEVNEKTEWVAKKLRESNNPKEAIIFSTPKDKKSSIKSIQIDERLFDISLPKDYEKVNFYVLSNDEEVNLKTTLKLIQKYKSYHDIKIYILTNQSSHVVILDSTPKGKITLEIVNEKERAIYNLLDQKPLFEGSINHKISLLVIGCGKVGSEFLKDAVWCSCMPEYQFEAHVIDLVADSIKEAFEVRSKEFVENYNINFVEANYLSNKMVDFVKKHKDVNYIMIAMNGEEKNLDCAMLMRELYLKYHGTKPSIHLWCDNDLKKDQIDRLMTQKKLSYDIDAFGSTKDMYYDNMIVDSKIESIAKQIHLAYDPTDTNFERYNEREYFKRSSRASAVHIKYKLYAILKEQYTDDLKANQTLLKEIYNDEIERTLVECEHDRWMAYVRSIGYTSVSFNKVKEYYHEIEYHENSLTKQHPAIVPNKDLDKVTKQLQTLNPEIDLKMSDVKIVRALVDGTVIL